MNQFTVTETPSGDWVAQGAIDGMTISETGESPIEAAKALLDRESRLYSETKVNLRMFPVCKCGYVFKNLSSKMNRFGIKRLSEKRCPRCGKEIVAVLAPSLKYSNGVMEFFVPGE